MSFLVWNYHGLGNLRIGKELEVVVRAKDPSVVFIVEIWANEIRLKEVQWNLDFENIFFVERKNRGGGLALYWRNSIDLSIDTFSKNHIDAIINKGKEDAWRFTSFFGEPVTHKSYESWNKLCQLNNKFNLPWICAGDFNEIVRSSEKLGESNKRQTQMQLFQDVIDECGFLKLNFVSSPFTWQKHFVDGHSLWERLDRGLANNDQLMKSTGTKIHHLPSDSFNHCPLWIVPNGMEVACFAKPFHFEEMWLSNWGCSDVVEAVWSSSEVIDPAIKVMSKIEKCGKELKRWNRIHFGNVKRELEKKRNLLKAAKQEAIWTEQNFRVKIL